MRLKNLTAQARAVHVIKFASAAIYCALLGLAAPSAARAADPTAGSDTASNAEMAEVTVTATRREESLSKVPISVSVLTSEGMEQKGIKDFTDVARFTPGVTIDASETNSISIRGISSSGGSGTTGIYLDDVPIQMRALGFNPDDTLPKIFDLDRIEVLRGPQGTLFGAGSEGGTVRYITPQPSFTTSSLYTRGEVSSTAGGALSYEAGIAGGAPVIDGKLGVRASVWYRRDGGWIDRVDPTTLAVVDKNANHDETLAIRLAAAWQLNDRVKISPSVLYQDRERNDVTIYWPNLSNPDRDRYVSANPTARPEPDRYYLPALNIEADLGKTRLVSTTSYFHRDDVSGYDGTLYNLGYYQSLPNAGFPGLVPSTFPLLDGDGIHLPPGLTDYRSPASVTNQQRNITQEVRLLSNDPTDRLVWTLGAFFSIGRQFSLEQIYDPMAEQFFNQIYGMPIEQIFTDNDGNPVFLLPNGDSYLNRVIGHDRQLAGFGEGTFAVTDRLRLTAGFRYAKTDYNFQSYSDGPQNGGPRFGGGSEHEKPFTPKAGVSYQLDPNNMLYATYAKGFRIGGGNAPVPAVLCGEDFANFGITAAPASYQSDTVQSYEIGAKNNIDNVVKLASSVFYIKWNNIQQSVLPPICQITWTENLGAAVAKGFDLQADFSIARALTIETAVGYTDARYTSTAFPGASTAVPPIVASGDAIVGQSAVPGAPWTVAIGATYNFQAFEHEAFFRIDYEYESQNHWLPATQDPNTSQYDPAQYTLSSTQFVSLRAGTTVRGWSVQAFVDNLLDTHVTTNFNHQIVDYCAPTDPAVSCGSVAAGDPLASPLYRNITFRPRTIGVSFSYRQ